MGSCLRQLTGQVFVRTARARTTDASWLTGMTANAREKGTRKVIPVMFPCTTCFEGTRFYTRKKVVSFA